MTAYTKMQGIRTKSFRRSLWYIAAFIAVLARGYYLLQANGLLELVTNTQQRRSRAVAVPWI